MKRLEIIHLRSSGEPLASLGDLISASIGQTDDTHGEENGTVVTLYRRAGLETDLAIHLEQAVDRGSSGLGLRLAAALRSYGLVEHTLWEELT